MSRPTLPTHDTGGVLRPLGHVPPKILRNVSAAPMQAEVPQDQWVEFDLRNMNSPIDMMDQNGRGACNGFAAATALEWTRYLAGLTHVDLSPWMIYAILCGGIDRGSNIGDALDLLSKTGTCPYADVAYGTINPNRITPANRMKAVNYRIEIGSKLTNFDELMSAAQLRQPFNFSLHVGNRFNTLDKNGCIPIEPGQGNHAICGGLGAKKLPDGEWAILFQNSWSTAWGDDGYAWFRRANITRQTWFESYAVLAAIDSPDDPSNPPAVLV